ncbi:MAG: molybdopterin molybdotransferase MoeA [Acetatifactor sp.]|nr:molybdopterin molybdotransferase MoeA [Acetatifactor sp.]
MEIEECMERLLAEADAIEETEWVDIDKVCGRVCADNVLSGMMVPHFPKSAMDGYAVKAEEVMRTSQDEPVKLKVLGELCAGDFIPFLHEPMSAVRVMTGAYVPEGFDAVIRQEDTDYGEKEVAVYRGVSQYTNYCKVGEDLQKGQILVPKRMRLTPLHIGLLASVGNSEIEVIRPVKVSILSTGSELCTVDEALAPGKIYNSIAYILQTAIRQEGLSVVSVQTCTDEEELLTQTIREMAEEADILITTGGVSVGKKDLIPEVLRALGAKVLFQGANIQPGTPTMASKYENTLLLHLSGNPYAALANFELYFWPLVAKMMGNESYTPKCSTAVLACEYPKINKMRRLIRAYAEAGEVTIPSEVHASSVIHNLAECNCFIDLEAGRAVQKGDTVKIRFYKNGF